MEPARAGGTRGLDALVLLFVLSGTAALIYEVVWYQSLTLIVGSSAVSMAVVLATYMGGMGFGSLAYLRWMRQRWHPLRVYAGLELIIAASGLLVLCVLPWAGGLYTAVGGGGWSGLLWRGLFCALFLLAPAMAMGATLPTAAAWLRATPAGVSRAGLYYSANIVGGVIGALGSAFYLLRVHDSAVASYTAMGLNLLVAGLAAWLARASTHERPAAGPVPPARPGRTAHRRVYAAIGLSGFCALGAEVIWTRNLALLLGGTVYTFALILAAMLLGLGVGSSIGAAAARGLQHPRRALALCQVAALLGLAWAAWSIGAALPYWPVDPRLAPSPWFVFQIDFARCLWVILPAALAWGASFPLALAAVADSTTDSDGSPAVARIYAANTGGAIAGALLTGLLLIPSLGTSLSQQLLLLLALGAAALALTAPVPGSPPGRRIGRYAGLLVAAAVLLLIGRWAVRPLPGVLVGFGRLAVTHLRGGEDFIHVNEGLNSTVAVSVTPDGTLSYHNAGKVQASTDPQDMRLQRMLGHLTTLLAREPRNVLVIGCGTGVTAGAVSIDPAVERQTIVEIEPQVPDVASRHFGRENHHVVANPKVSVQVDDARHFLLTTTASFDAITTDPFDAWVKGTATLNTVEFYREMKRHLNPGGVVTVWVPFYETDLKSVKSELATFLSVFPHAALFGNTAGGQGYDGVLVGSAEPLRIDQDALAARLQRPDYAPVLRSLAEVDYGSAAALLATFATEGEPLHDWLADAELNRDRNLRLQYLAGLALNRYDERAIYREIVARSKAGRARNRPR